MPTRAASPDWLPDHQLDVVMTLGHADEVTGRLCDLLYDYAQAEPLGLTNVFDDDLCHVTVTGVAPLPPAVPRLAADVLTQLRATIEHAVYAEVEAALGRELTSDEGRRIEMPATKTSDVFAEWLKRSMRKELPPLREGSDLVKPTWDPAPGTDFSLRASPRARRRRRSRRTT